MNKNNAHEYKHFVDALIAGKTITYRGHVFDDLSFDGNPEDYAIVEPPKPVPLTNDDMEPGCHIRFSDSKEVIAITRLMSTGVKLENGISYDFEEIMTAEIYRPSTRTWSPAHK